MVIKRIRPAAMCSRPDRKGGGYLLSHFRSTIGVAGFNFSVRNGKEGGTRAVTTLVFFLFPVVAVYLATGVVEEADFWKLIRDSDPIEASNVHWRPSRGGVACEPLH